MKRGYLAVFCAAALLLASCGGPSVPIPSSAGDGGAAASGSTRPPLTGGSSLIAATETEAVSTEVRTVTEAGGQVVTGADGVAVTSIAYPATTTTTGKAPDTDMTARIPQTPTSRTAATTTTSTSPPASTIRPATTTTAPRPADPWRSPYNLTAIYADCRKEIERLGMTWKEELRPDNCAWANPESTVPNTYFPDDCYLQDDVFEMIRFYHDVNTRRYCRIWFEADPDSPGDYRFYFLEEY